MDDLLPVKVISLTLVLLLKSVRGLFNRIDTQLRIVMSNFDLLPRFSYISVFSNHFLIFQNKTVMHSFAKFLFLTAVSYYILFMYLIHACCCLCCCLLPVFFPLTEVMQTGPPGLPFTRSASLKRLRSEDHRQGVFTRLKSIRGRCAALDRGCRNQIGWESSGPPQRRLHYVLVTLECSIRVSM